jgi:membrane protein DedA with SNARE-associated domain
MPSDLIDLIAAYPYITVFIGLLIGGETILLPALYLGVLGVLNVWAILVIMIISTVISDTFWYTVGRGLIPQFVEKSFSEKRRSQLEKLSSVIKGKELAILFYSKFIYGTRIAAQILCGARKVPFWKYQSINILAVVVLGIVYYLLVRSSFMIVGAFESLQHNIIAIMVLVAIAATTIHYILYTLTRRIWYQ